MKRVAIIGVSGSGKTTLGHKLAGKLGAQSVDLDELFWEPGWNSALPEVFEARLHNALQAPRWVTSGNYSRVEEQYLAAADTLIFLDYSFPVVWGRVLRRTWRRVVHKEPCCNGNTESWRTTLSRDSILLWVLKTYRKRRAQGARLMTSETFPHLQKLHFRSPRATQNWLDAL